MTKTACIQINSSNDIDDNIAKITQLSHQAAEQGAKFILTPENSFLMYKTTHELFEKAHIEQECKSLKASQDLAKSLNIHLLIGSIAIKPEKGGAKYYNRSYMISPAGEIINRYDKIHLYNADLDNGEIYDEAKSFIAGDKKIMAELPFGNLGMTICYDLRFASLFRSLAQSGADFITVPAAFTKYTGMSHWRPLLRARAIENGCYILAPAQTGLHPSSRETFGHSMIIDPWGEILDEIEEEEGFVIADIDPKLVHKTRASLPSLEHDRDYS